MKQRFVVVALMVLIAMSLVPAFAQDSSTVRGVCKDMDGKPVTGAVVEWLNMDNGRKYELKTNNKGEYFSLGIAPGKYKVSLLKDGKDLFHFNGVGVGIGEINQDFDLKKEMAASAMQQGVTPEQIKAQQEQAEKANKEVTTVKSLNEKLAAAKTSADTGDFDSAVSQLTEATQIDPNRDLLWAKLGEYELSSAGKQTDSGEKTKRYGTAVDDYQKAIDLKQKALEADPKKNTPDAAKVLAQYYNNLGQADSKAGKTDDAVKAYTQAAHLDPAGASQYYFNLGAIMTNNGKIDEAIAAFDQSITADPTKADAYYWKGVNLIGKATLKGDKMIAPDGTSEAFNKYLELQPTGQFADAAKQMLASIGATIETQFGKTKKAPPPKK